MTSALLCLATPHLPFFWCWFWEVIFPHSMLSFYEYHDQATSSGWLSWVIMPTRLFPGALNGGYGVQGWPMLKYTLTILTMEAGTFPCFFLPRFLMPSWFLALLTLRYFSFSMNWPPPSMASGTCNITQNFKIQRKEPKQQFGLILGLVVGDLASSPSSATNQLCSSDFGQVVAEHQSAHL